LDLAHQIKWVVEERYPEAERLRVVLDNLNRHKGRRPWMKRSRPKRRGALSRSWSSITDPGTAGGSRWPRSSCACFSVNVWSVGSLTKRGSRHEVGAWEKARNEAQATIDRRFSITEAGEKLKRLYPSRSS
jgi:hypothetical protein